MSSAVDVREPVGARPSLRRRRALPEPRARSRVDVLFVAAVGALLAVHATIFFSTLILAPVSLAEQRSLDLVHLPVEAARALALPFHALLLASLFVLGRRAAGRWAGFGAMLAVLALDLHADTASVVHGPGLATGGWASGALLAAAFAVLPRRRLLAAVLLGAASAFHGLAVLALPAFLIALAVEPVPRSPRRSTRLLTFAGAWALPAVGGQVVWLAGLGAEGWQARLGEYTAELRPHQVVPLLEQQRILYSAWHFDAALTATLVLTLFTAAFLGVMRYLVVPRARETGPRALAIAARLPVEFRAAGLVLVVFGIAWALSGRTAVVDPNIPALVAAVPLITAMAYRGAKWLLTLNRFWRVCAVVYLTGLIVARSTQLVFTLVQAFQV